MINPGALDALAIVTALIADEAETAYDIADSTADPAFVAVLIASVVRSIVNGASENVRENPQEIWAKIALEVAERL